MSAPSSYSRTQIILHWTIVVLAGFQIVAHDAIQAAWAGRLDGSLPNEPTPQLHAIIGMLIFALTIWRLVLRMRRGVPALPASEPSLLKLAASATHILFYVVLLGMPVSGSLAWFFGIEQSAGMHKLAYYLLLVLILVHFIGALAQHFWFKTDVLKRIVGRA